MKSDGAPSDGVNDLAATNDRGRGYGLDRPGRTVTACVARGRSAGSPAAAPRAREAILIGRNGRLRQDLVARLLRQRDDHRVRLQE